MFDHADPDNADWEGLLRLRLRYAESRSGTSASRQSLSFRMRTLIDVFNRHGVLRTTRSAFTVAALAIAEIPPVIIRRRKTTRRRITLSLPDHNMDLESDVACMEFLLLTAMPSVAGRTPDRVTTPHRSKTGRKDV
jgi:hypothetical protein